MNRARALRVSLLVSCTLLLVLVAVSGTSADTGTGQAGGQTVVTGATPGTTGGAQTGTAGSSGSGTATGAASSTGQGSLTSAQSVYVAEHEIDQAKVQQASIGYHGFAAFIDGTIDRLVTRTPAGTQLNEVAVAPDGSRVYMSDSNEPVLHVFDAETAKLILDVKLPGVTVRDMEAWLKAAQDSSVKVPYSTIAASGTGVASTPDGALVLVCTNAGLMVVDTTTYQVVRTLPDLLGGSVAVSFDGKRAYVSSQDFRGLEPHTWGGWIGLVAGGERARLVCIDLETWQIVKEIDTVAVASIAVKPDDSQVFFSEPYKHLVRVVDALTLDDLWSVKTDPSYALGLGFVPNGTKAYVVCSADVGAAAYYSGQSATVRKPTAEEYFCGVIDTSEKEIVKRIPLEAY